MTPFVRIFLRKRYFSHFCSPDRTILQSLSAILPALYGCISMSPPEQSQSEPDSTSLTLPAIWKQLNRGQKSVFVLSLAAYAGGAMAFAAAISGLFGERLQGSFAIPSAVIAALGLLLGSTTSTIARHKSRQEFDERRYFAAEERTLEHPEMPRFAWDLARIKLESYLDRNLNHVTAIFYLTAIAMTCGAGLIGVGIWKSMHDPEGMAPAILATLTGIVLQAIGGTFLVIYKSTMQQANKYVVVLERINAVGMSINILETIDDADRSARDTARIQLAKELLSLYHPASSHSLQTAEQQLNSGD